MVTLAKFTGDDIQNLLSWISDEKELIMFSGTALSYPLKSEDMQHLMEDESKYICKAINKDTGIVIGHGELNDIDITNKRGRICRVYVEKNKRGLGYGRQIVRCLKEIAKKEFGIETLTLRVYENNRNAVRCYTKCGFETIGKIHNTLYSEGTYYSTLIMKCTL